MNLLKPGTLWQDIERASGRALASGALLPIPTDHAFIEDGGVRFFVRVLAGLRRKSEARKEQDAAAQAGKNSNPFLPPEKDLTVADITDTHLAILNKFNVVERHLLVITRHFEEQESLLTQADFEALWLCLAEFNALGFYNGGAAGGASQRHKHLQIVPLPLAPEGPPVPMQPLLDQAARDDAGREAIPAFPFRNAFMRIPAELWKTPGDAARWTEQAYGRMLRQVGMDPPSRNETRRQSHPYCLLVTREWLLLVPRSKEHFEEISFNSLAYAGSLFVWNERLLGRLRAYGPFNALREVGLHRR